MYVMSVLDVAYYEFYEWYYRVFVSETILSEFVYVGVYQNNLFIICHHHHQTT